MENSTMVNISTKRTPNEQTWELLLCICEDDEVLAALINQIAKIPYFTDEMEEAIRVFLDEAIEAHVLIPPNNHWDPSEINFTDLQYGLIKGYEHMFNEVKFYSKYPVKSSSPLQSSRRFPDFGEQG